MLTGWQNTQLVKKILF